MSKTTLLYIRYGTQYHLEKTISHCLSKFEEKFENGQSITVSETRTMGRDSVRIVNRLAPIHNRRRKLRDFRDQRT